MTRLRRISIILISTILGLGLIAYGSTYFFAKDIKNAVVAKLNAHLNTPVQVDDIYFSIFSEFPKSSVVFDKIKVDQSEAILDSSLATIERISVTLNIWDVLRRKPKIQEIVLNNGSINLATGKDGKANYSIFKPSADTSSNNQELTLSRVILNNIRITYSDKQRIQDFLIDGEQLEFSGDFQQSIYQLAIKGNFLLTYQDENNTWVDRRPVNLNTSLEVDQEKEELRFIDTEVLLEQMTFGIDGAWAMSGDVGIIGIRAKSLQLKELLNLLPTAYSKELKRYQSEGLLQMNTRLIKKEGQRVIVKSNFKVNDGKLFLEEVGEGLSGIKLEGDFEQSPTKQEIVIKAFQTRLFNDKIVGSFSLKNFDDPFLNLKCKGEVHLENLDKVIDLKNFSQASGSILLDVQASGKVKDFDQGSGLKNVDLKGVAKGNNVQLVADSGSFDLKNFTFFLNMSKESIRLQKLVGQWQGHNFDGQYEVLNLFPYLFDKKTLKLDGELHLDQWAFSENSEASNSSNVDTFRWNFPERVYLNSSLSVDKVSWKKLRLEKVQSKMVMGSAGLRIKNCHALLCSGEADFKGTWTMTASNQNKFSGNLKTKQIDVKELFRQFEDFGQEEITQKQISGILNGNTDLAFLLDHEGNLISKSLYVFSDISILDGRLVNYKTLESLSRFVDIADLKDVRFDRLNNEIEIRDETVIIPEMELKNSALNLVMEGSHQFSGAFNYMFELQLKDLMTSKYSKNFAEEEFEKTEEGIKVFIKMVSDGKDVKTSYNLKKARKSFRQEMKKERETARDLIRKELGLDKKDNTQKEKKSGDSKEGTTNWEDDIPE